MSSKSWLKRFRRTPLSTQENRDIGADVMVRSAILCSLRPERTAMPLKVWMKVKPRKIKAAT